MRPQRFVLPWMVAGLFSAGAMLAFRAGAETPEPIPGPEEGTRTVNILKARDAGAIAVVARGKGEDRVRISIRNTSGRRLKVVMPPGLVAAAATGQLQSMGLGEAENLGGAFGTFDPGNSYSEGDGMDLADGSTRGRGVVVPPGLAVDLVMPGVCLNFGLPTPTPHDVFRLVDVDEYTPQPSARKALRSLARIGTSHGVAQAIAWHVFNGMSFDELAQQQVQTFNAHELALAAGFVDRLGDDGGDLLDPAALTRDRITIQVQGEGPLLTVAHRLEDDLDGHRILGLPVRASAPRGESPTAPALHLDILLAPGKVGSPPRARVIVRYAASRGAWSTLGIAPLEVDGAWSNLDGPTLGEAVDRAIAGAFVSARPIRHSVGLTTLRIDNRLPFTLAHVIVQAGTAPVPLPAIGIGPGRHGSASIQAARGTIDRVELNGL